MAFCTFPSGQSAQKMMRSSGPPEANRLNANPSKGLFFIVPGNCSILSAISRFRSRSRALPNISSLAANSEKLASYEYWLISDTTNQTAESEIAIFRSEEHTSELQ